MNRALVAFTMASSLLVSPLVAQSSFDAVLSLSPATESSCVAVQIPTPEGLALTGLTWFHNDSQSTFPRVLLLEGVGDAPPDIASPGLVLTEVEGVSSGWGQVAFQSPVTSSTGVAYAVFFFPPGETTDRRGQGGGPGIGVVESAGGAVTYLTGDGVNWAQFDPSFSVGVAGEFEVSKRQPLFLASLGQAEEAAPRKAPATLLGAPRPNPFNPSTEILFSLARPGPVQLVIHDVRGRRVVDLVSGSLAEGEYRRVWRGIDASGSQVASGVYFVTLRALGVSSTKRLVLVR